MANYWAIAIGINHYKHFQSLSYAERDAQTLHNFLVVQAGFSPEHCLLLTDQSPVLNVDEGAPNRDTILGYIGQICQNHLQPGDVFWCFFSGYGVKFQDKDYLMPMDGDPTEVATTGIPLESLFSIFRAARTDNILLLLDINRSQGVLGAAGVGAQTIALAKEYGIATMLSCPPEQFSHETLGLRLGLFTAALLEGLGQYGCLTLEHLAQFMGDRLPQLSEHHCRPPQDPVSIVPEQKRYQLILPGKVNSTGEEPGAGLYPGGSGSILPTDPTPPTVEPTPLPPPTGGNPGSEQPTPGPEDAASEQTWKQLVSWGSAILLGLIGLVISRNAGQVLQTPAAEISPTPVPTVVSPVGSLPPPASPLLPPTDSGADLGSFTKPADPTSLPPGNAGNQGIDFTVPPVPSPGSLASPVPGGAAGGQAGDSVVGTLVPPASPAPIAPSPSPGTPSNSDQAIINAAMASLSRFRAETPNNQVSDIVEAIRQVRQVPPGQPLYLQAQQIIDRWSQVILDMAVGRSQQRNNGDSVIAAKNYRSAIAAARMVPTDRPALHSISQQLVAEWSQKILDIANARAKEGYLSLAIQVAQEVPAGTPAYASAQQAIATWQAAQPPSPPPTAAHV
ncbi:MAG TPA: caspase family protein [Synechococcales cyanobacterium M55_K2018_004]|nr:caspase family protein [Synechococcales cyanobacterium M55_K2018_004]